MKSQFSTAVAFTILFAFTGNSLWLPVMAADYMMGDGNTTLQPVQEPPSRKQWTVDEYKQAASNGDIESMYQLGKIYSGTTGITEDLGQAAFWYEQAAYRGHAEAQFELGAMILEGRGVPQNLDLAMKWFLAAAARGNADAENAIGEMYAGGLGVQKDPFEAAKWWRASAEKGDECSAIPSYLYDAEHG